METLRGFFKGLTTEVVGQWTVQWLGLPVMVAFLSAVGSIVWTHRTWPEITALFLILVLVGLSIEAMWYKRKTWAQISALNRKNKENWNKRNIYTFNVTGGTVHFNQLFPAETEENPPEKTIQQIKAEEPPGNIIEDKDVRLCELVENKMPPIIHRKTFIKCKIYGPAVLVLVNSLTMVACEFGVVNDDIRTILFEIETPRTVVGPIAADSCKFIDCEFTGVGFMGNKEIIDKIENSVSKKRD